jgi:hypothetical protein
MLKPVCRAVSIVIHKKFRFLPVLPISSGKEKVVKTVKSGE